jgi:hypothetical protein
VCTTGSPPARLDGHPASATAQAASGAHIGIDAVGAVRWYRAERWRNGKAGYLPFGADVQDERTFDGLTIPGVLEAGWGHGTGEFSPFFRCEVTALEPID